MRNLGNKKLNKIKRIRVFLGPVDYAGLLWGYKKCLESEGVDAKVIVFNKHPFDYHSDITFNLKKNKVLRAFERIYHFPSLLYHFDVFNFVAGNSLLPFRLDVPILKLFRKKIVIKFVGSDIRPREIKEEKQITDKELRRKKKLVKFWEKYADAIISNPEYSQLLTKKYYKIAQGCDLQYWKPFGSKKLKKNKDKILIIHAPSHKSKKGTKYIIKAIELLKEQGYKIEFKLLENLSNSEIRREVNVSDIIVDQLIVGWYGIFSVEAMALAKPTLCYINPDWKKEIDYAKNIPIVNTNSTNVYDNLKLLIENPNLRKNIGNKGRIYVEDVHNPKKIGKQLLDLYLGLFEKKNN